MDYDFFAIRPHERSWARRFEGDKTVMMCGGCIAINGDEILTNDDDENEHGNVPPRMLTSPSMPSRQEVQEHSITHLPYRSWCPYCVMGKMKASPHKRGVDHTDDAIPTVSFDYCFMGEKMKSIPRISQSLLGETDARAAMPSFNVHKKGWIRINMPSNVV